MANALKSGADSKCESVFMFSMFAAEVFPGWTFVEDEAPGLTRLSGARASRKTNANALEQRLCFEVRVRFHIFIVSADVFSGGPPWKTSPGPPPAAWAFVRA